MNNGKSRKDVLASAYPEFQWKAHRFIRASIPTLSISDILVDAEKLLSIQQVSTPPSPLAQSPLTMAPFQPADWNRITFSQLKKAVRLPVSITKPEVIERLKEKYPEYEWSNQNLLEKKRGTQGRKRDSYWMDPQNRRRLFVELAHTKGFDPMVPKNWRSITPADIVTQGVTKKAVHPVKAHSLFNAIIGQEAPIFV